MEGLNWFHSANLTLRSDVEGIREAVNKYLCDKEKAFYFEGVRKKPEQSWAKCIALKGDYIAK